MRYFIIITIKNAILRTLVDGIRLFADPLQKHSAHITVRGPYESQKESIDYIKKLNEWEQEIIGTHINVVGVATFFNTTQNTIYFKCESEELRSIWWKKNFKGFTPHITLYDKADRAFAESILEILESKDISFNFTVQSLDRLITRSNKFSKSQTDLFNYPKLYTLVNLPILNTLLETSFIDKDFLNLTKHERLFYIDRLSTILMNHHEESVLSPHE
jgi:2'-5' RNA ligase